MATRLRFAWVLAVAACSFDAGGFEERACTVDGDCRPDESCTEGYCAQRSCTMASECGDGWQLTCASGRCYATACTALDDCELGFLCEAGFCAAGCPDHDGDGAGAGTGCTGVADCDDADPAEVPGGGEGPAGDPTCADGKDNDCDGAVDTDELACQPCTMDEECADDLYCNGTERCDGTSCGPGDAVDCSGLDGVCQLGVCDEAADACATMPAPADTPCEDGDGCTGPDACDAAGACVPGPLPDGDMDGFAPLACGGGDCDDGAPAVNPDATEGPVGDATCGDGADNDCDTLSDLADTACVTCTGPAECDDLNPCTEDVCEAAGTCSNLPNDAGVPAPDGFSCTTDSCSGGLPAYVPIAGACDDGVACTVDSCAPAAPGAEPLTGCLAAPDHGACDDGNGCTDGVCAPGGAGSDPATGCRQDPNTAPCDDGASCTTGDTCSGGACAGVADDASCGGGQVCRPACFTGASGCGTPPAVTVTCPATAAAGAPGATCTVDLGTLAGQTPCLTCGTALGMTLLDRTTFAGCSLGAWTASAGTPGCPVSLAPLPWGLGDGDALEAASSSFTIQRTVDTRGLDQLRLCFDYAARNADGGEAVTVSLNTGGGYASIFSDNNGPTGQPDANFVPTCVDLDAAAPAAADNPALGIRIQVSSNNAGDRTIIDDVALHGWRGADVSFTTVFADPFGAATCDVSQWTATGAPVCPLTTGPLAGTVALEAENASWTLETSVDASALCDDVRIGFRHGTRTPNAGERLLAAFDAGGGWTTAFQSEGLVGATDTWFTFGACPPGSPVGCAASVSDDAPAAAFDPSLGLRFTATSNDVGRMVFLDDVAVSGAVCGPGDAWLTVGPVAEVGAGSYTVSVQAPAQTTAWLTCSWDGATPTAEDRARIVFTP